MSKDNDFSPLLTRLNLIIDAAKAGLAGAELGQLVLIALGQQKARFDMNLSRAGRKRALDVLVALKYVELVVGEPRLHSEIRAKYAITETEGGATDSELLKCLIEGLSANKATRKNLYSCNAYGELASEDELEVLYSQLFNAAVRCAVLLGGVTESVVCDTYQRRNWECSRESEMRGFASVIQGFLDGLDRRMWPGDLSRAIYAAIYHVQACFPPVLDPHGVLEKWRIRAQRIHEIVRQRYAQEDAANAMQILAVPAPAPRSQDGKSSTNG